MGDDDWFERLVRLGAMGERERRQIQAQERGMAFADLDRVRIAPEALARLDG